MSDSSRDGATQISAYALGHSDKELDRLGVQSHVVDPITRQLFRDAGIGLGMRVLDVGSGAGDVAFLAADLVGSAGEVIGADISPTAVVAARARANARLYRNVSFRKGDPAEMAFERPFDAVVGRYVLMFFADPVATLRKLTRHVFHEVDWDGARSFPPAPTFDRCCRWLVETFRLLGTETRMGIKLHATFVAAGLPPPTMRLEAIICGSADSSDRLNLVVENARSLLPAMERMGVATAAEVGIETLADRVRSEVVAGCGVVVGRSEIGAWSRVSIT